MGKTYKLSDIDDVREMVIDLDENRRALTGSKLPVSAILAINQGGVQKTRVLEVDGAAVKFRWTDADLAEFGAGATDEAPVVLSARVHTKFSDGSDGCFPTPPSFLTIIIGEANPPTLS